MSTTQRPPLSREVIVLGWVSFFNDVSSEMIYPLLPLFMVAVLGASATSLGWVEGVATAAVALLTAWAGWRSDRFRKRVPYVRLGYGLPVIGIGILVAAVAWPFVLVGRTVDRVGKGIRSSPRDALIADTTTAADRGRAFGLHRAMDSAGAVVGVLLAAVLLWWLTGTPTKGGTLGQREHAEAAFRTIFAVAAVLGLAAVGFTFVLREPPHEPAAHAPTTTVVGFGALSSAYWKVLALLIVFSLANTGRVALWPLLAVYGVYIALTDGVGKALLADHVPRERRGFAIGLFYMATGATTLVSSVVAGELWDRVGPASPFWFGGLTAAAAVVLLVVMRPWRGQHERA